MSKILLEIVTYYFKADYRVKVAFSVLFLSWQQLQISCKVTFLFASVGFKLLWATSGRSV